MRARVAYAPRAASEERTRRARADALVQREEGPGFIRTDEGERLQVDGTGFAAGERPEERCAEKVVTFEVEQIEEGRRAQNVVFERQVAARRARLSGSGRGVTR